MNKSCAQTKDTYSEFTFSDANQLIIESLLKKYPQNFKASAVLPVLDLAQRQCKGWLPRAALAETAILLEMPFIRVYEVASFYSMFNLSPVGLFQIKVCGTTPCWLRGSESIMQACKAKLGIELNQTTADNMFTLTEFECLGACTGAPVVQINDDYYENQTPKTIDRLLSELSSTVVDDTRSKDNHADQ